MAKFARITQVRRIKGSKLHLQIQQIIESDVQAGNLLARFNSADPAFNRAKEQWAWLTIDKGNLADLQAEFIDFPAEAADKLEHNEVIALDILAPSWNIQLEETTIPNEWQLENVEDACKQIELSEKSFTNGVRYNLSKGKQGMLCSDTITNDKQGKLANTRGYFLTVDGEPIFVNKRVVEGKPAHQKVERGDFILVHETEVPFQVGQVDLTKGSKMTDEELALEELKAKEEATV